jgi:hypothetical protein
MKKTSFALSIFTLFSFSSCGKDDSDTKVNITGNSNIIISGNIMKIKIGSQTFTALLYDNPTVTALKQRLPLTITMNDLNNNEKYYSFADPLPVNATHSGNINKGDLMLYQTNTLVLFYKTFSTSYNYTPLGKIENFSGLEAALGSANIVVTLELE